MRAGAGRMPASGNGAGKMPAVPESDDFVTRFCYGVRGAEEYATMTFCLPSAILSPGEGSAPI